MSMRYKGAILSATPPTTTGGTTGSGSAPGEWTLSQQMQAAGAWPSTANYIEDVFSTYLWTGTGAAQTFNNGVNLSDKGGMVWIKQRSSPIEDWRCIDSARGITNGLQQNLTNAQQNWTGLGYITSFNTNGFSIGTNVSINTSTYTYGSWTFRKQPKFFDVVTYTGNGTAGRTVAHNLGSVPGCMIVRPTSAVDDWFVYHRSLLNSQSLFLNLTAAASNTPSAWNSTTPTDTVFTVGTNTATNANGVSYVAYLFAHNAGGFGASGTDNVITCGSLTASGGAATVDLGYEPQWLLFKQTTAATPWSLIDNMRNWNFSNVAELQTSSSNAEDPNAFIANPTATGFSFGSGTLATSGTYIYVAIRRGPMKTPTTGTSVFTPTAYTGNGSSQSINAGFPIDLSMFRIRASIGQTLVDDRLRGVPKRLFTDTTGAETTSASAVTGLDSNTSVTVGLNGDTNSNATTYVNWNFRRAPGFFDEVCYTGDGTTGRSISHNLGVTPELIILKSRNVAGTNWYVNGPFTTWSLGYPTGFLNLTDQISGNTTTGIKSPTSTTFVVNHPNTNSTSGGGGYVAYLFASCPGVSKVGTYTGTGATQTIDCGFTGGARWVMIKRTDSTGDWYVWDTARGMVAGTDPSVLFNTTAAEVNADSVYTTGVGFQIVSTAAGINTSGGTYIYLAIA